MATGKTKASSSPKTAPKGKASTKEKTATAKKAVKASPQPKVPQIAVPPALSHIEAKVMKQIITKLEEMREESLQVVNTHVKADLRQREDGGEVGDDMDQASNERDREFSLIIHQRHLKRLHQIVEAFERIETGIYGLCEGTEEPINPKRLLIMPLARFSLEYQQQQEKMHGRSPDQTQDSFEESMISDE